MVGPETQEVFERLVPEDDTYEKALKAPDEHFSVKKNVPFERSVFHQARQKSGESIEQFVTRLRKLAATCDHGDTTNEQIRYQVIATCTSSKLRKRLLSETDLTSDKVLEIGKIKESAHHNKEIETKAGSKSKDGKLEKLRKVHITTKKLKPKPELNLKMIIRRMKNT